MPPGGGGCGRHKFSVIGIFLRAVRIPEIFISAEMREPDVIVLCKKCVSESGRVKQAADCWLGNPFAPRAPVPRRLRYPGNWLIFCLFLHGKSRLA
jgi:hypothetical protein